MFVRRDGAFGEKRMVLVQEDANPLWERWASYDDSSLRCMIGMIMLKWQIRSGKAFWVPEVLVNLLRVELEVQGHSDRILPGYPEELLRQNFQNVLIAANRLEQAVNSRDLERGQRVRDDLHRVFASWAKLVAERARREVAEMTGEVHLKGELSNFACRVSMY